MKDKIFKILKIIIINTGLFLLFIIILLISVLIDIASEGTAAPNQCMTKWEGKNCELYILEEPNGMSYNPGIFLYKDENLTEHLYDVVFDSNYIHLYEHREKPDDKVNEIATYTTISVSSNRDKAKFELVIRSPFCDVVLPKKIKLKNTKKNLTAQDIPYSYCYGDPSKLNNKVWTITSNYSSSLYLYVSNEGKSGVFTYIDRETKDIVEYNVIFDTEQIMTVYDKCTEEKIASYYVYYQEDDGFYAIMKTKVDEKWRFNEKLWFIKARGDIMLTPIN